MKRTKRIQMGAGAVTTVPGYTNTNGQTVVRGTGAASAVRTGQSIYRVRCGHCTLEYGVAGIDIKDRLCPGCQDGTPGETLRDAVRGPSLFDALQ